MFNLISKRMEPQLLLEKELEPIFLQKFPPFSEGLKEGIAQFGPYVLLLFSILGIIGLLGAAGLGGLGIGMGVVSFGTGFRFYVGILIAILMVVLYLLAFSPLKARKKSGWNLIYYALLISLLSNLVQLNIFGFIVGGLLGFWILFQIREKYI